MNVLQQTRLLTPVSEHNGGSAFGEGEKLFRERILIVDDNQDAADSLAMLLEYVGLTVRVANSGDAALGMLDEFRPGVILMDIAMPGMDGHEVARRVREQPHFSKAKLIALSGWGQEEDKQRSSESGFGHHLTKPVDFAMLESLLGNIKRPPTP